MNEALPTRFGRYELQERLGTGGMAVVYRALYTAAPGVTKPVVIKRVLSSYAGDPAFAEMFLNEARICVGLSHGNIVQVFDFGQADGEFFLAMELVDGQSLAQVLRVAKHRGLPLLPAPLAVGIAIDMCRGLHHAHTRVDAKGEPLGVVHRDLSPENVLVSYEGEVKLSDFGIAKARLAGRAETEVGVVKGKYHYLSPEQARAAPLDARSDVYTVGVVLYQMLCGQRPVEGNEFAVLRGITQGELTPALSLNPTLDPDLQSILQLALATQREQRYRSAEALQQSLSDWMGLRAPRFPTHARKHLMGWLFQEQLVAARRPPQLPPDFESQLQSWRGRYVPPAPTPPPMAIGAKVARPSKSAESPRAVTPPPEPPRARPRSSRQGLSATQKAAGAAGLGLVALLVGWQVSRAQGGASTQPPVIESDKPPPPETPVVVGTSIPEQHPTPEQRPHGDNPLPPDQQPTTGHPTTTGHHPPSEPQLTAEREPTPEEKGRTALENGLFWGSRGEDTKAMGWYQQCLELDRSTARCHTELARIYAKRGVVKDAIRYYTQLLALEPEGDTAEEARRYIRVYASSSTP